MNPNQLPRNSARNALTIRKNARATTGQKPALFAKVSAQGAMPPNNQTVMAKQVQFVDHLQMEYRSFIFNMTPSAVTATNTEIVSQTLMGKSKRRRYLFIQNNSPNADIYLSFGNGESTTLSDYIVIPRSTSFELTSAPNNEITIYAQDIALITPQPQAIVSVLVGSISE